MDWGGRTAGRVLRICCHKQRQACGAGWEHLPVQYTWGERGLVCRNRNDAERQSAHIEWHAHRRPGAGSSSVSQLRNLCALKLAVQALACNTSSKNMARSSRHMGVSPAQIPQALVLRLGSRDRFQRKGSRARRAIAKRTWG